MRLLSGAEQQSPVKRLLCTIWAVLCSVYQFCKALALTLSSELPHLPNIDLAPPHPERVQGSGIYSTTTLGVEHCITRSSKMGRSQGLMMEKAIITLQSKEGHRFRVDLVIAKQIPFVSYALEASKAADDQYLELAEISGHILHKLINYCCFHLEFKQRWDKAYRESRDVKTLNEEEALWDSTFLSVDDETLVQLLVAADFLNFNQLKDKIFTKLANLMPIVDDVQIMWTVPRHAWL